MTLRSRQGWKSATAALLLLVPLGLASAQAASPQLCRQLEADLAASKKGNQSSALARQYDRAIEAQERQLAKTEAQWQRAGCGYEPGDGSDRLCRDIEDTLAQMDSNYEQLRQERARIEAPRNGQAERRRIQREIKEAGCLEPKPAPVPKPKEAAVPRPSAPASQMATPPESRLRTVCVRTCDGYFFPMSYGVTRGEFPRDAKSCQATCPSTQMKLYYHKVPEQESADMVSVDKDEPYASLPTANLYRKQDISQPGSCGCAPASSEEIAVSTPNQPTEVAPPSVTEQPANAPAPSTPEQPGVAAAPSAAPSAPTPPTAPAESPSILVLPDQSTAPAAPQTATLPPAGEPKVPAPALVIRDEEEAAAKAPAAPPARPPEPAPARTMSEANKRVRVVGPTFLPGQEEAIDLRAPGRTTNP